MFGGRPRGREHSLVNFFVCVILYSFQASCSTIYVYMDQCRE